MADLNAREGMANLGEVDGNRLSLGLGSLRQEDGTAAEYDLRNLRRKPLQWDRVVSSGHLTNCWYQRSCNYHLYVSDGVVLREEQVGNYPPPNDAGAPDNNPRGCQKGACYAQRTYDPTRIKYPLKRAGARGEGRWQRISWEQALTEIADGMLDILTTDGPSAIVQGGGTRVHSQGSDGISANTFFEALGIPIPSQNTDIGDEHQGAAITFGKIMFADSGDNWYHADTILVWGGNPAYTNTPNYHYIVEGRYRGARVITISPDLNPSAIHADLWVPVNVGTDAALALSMAQVLISEGLYKVDFVREQTDLPILVRTDNGKFLREADLKRGGREDVFYFFDQASKQITEANRSTLALDRRVPALDGEYQVQTLQGTVRVRPVFQALRERLDERFTPEQATKVTGVPESLIRELAREVATSKGVVNISTSNWGKFYHGDLIERAIVLVFALCGQMGRKGASYSAFPALTPDTAVGALERRGHQMLTSAAGSDPRYAGWKEDGYTTEMILSEYVKDAIAVGALACTTMVQFVHGGLLDLAERHPEWDPHLKRPLGEYVTEALDKAWQVVLPARGKDPKMLFQIGGNVFRRGRATNQLLQHLLPKLKLLVTVDFRMSSTGLLSDYILPACGWYERSATCILGSSQSPFFQLVNKATDPLYESLSDWSIFVRLAEKLAERARERHIVSYLDHNGRERRIDRLVDAVTTGGIYGEDDEEGVARDVFLNSANREPIEWEEFKERGIAKFMGIGLALRSLGNACDLEVGEPLVPLTWHTDRKEPYPTLTRRIQFYIDHDWYIELDEHLPAHKDCPTAGGDYPLQLTGGHARWSIHSDWIDDSVILALQRGQPGMFISAKDAASRGIRDGDLLEVYNDAGSFQIQAMVAAGIRPGQVVIYHAWENFQFEGWRHFKSVMASPMNPIELVGGYGHLRPDVVSLSPGTSDRGSRVEVEKASPPGD